MRTLPHEELRRRFDYRKMVALQIYSKRRAAASTTSQDEVLHLLEAFDVLQSFVAVTAQRGEGATAYLT